MKKLKQWFLLNFLGIKPPPSQRVGVGGISHTIVCKEFDEKYRWDKHKFSNIRYI